MLCEVAIYKIIGGVLNRVQMLTHGMSLFRASRFDETRANRPKVRTGELLIIQLGTSRSNMRNKILDLKSYRYKQQAISSLPFD